MSNPRIEVDLSKIRHNTQTAVQALHARGISVTAVTKAVCGHPAIAQAMLDGGATGLAESRLSNVKRLRKAGQLCPITLIRTPMLSQVDEVVQVCDASYNTEIAVITALATAAIRHDCVHNVILMVEMGDNREGIMPADLGAMAQRVVDLPGVALKGIGANFACLTGVAPDAAAMEALSSLTSEVEGQCGPFLQTVSGGNSANLPWAFSGNPTGRVNDLRLGEAILLGVDPVSGGRINGMHTDAFSLVAEVIEANNRSVPLFQSSVALRLLAPRDDEPTRLILALGHQDTDILGLLMPVGTMLIGATSDHLVIGTTQATMSVGSEVRFQMTYSALMRAMAAPDIKISMLHDRQIPRGRNADEPRKHLEIV
ncbi:alanine/ornithine racemase family PLP-dependent enzyme [Octadecabacter sp. CECT 8868]|uniref:alanine/ornithine racemase family PLP-dependent enzyme n=1 Tax=Octadecabacter algicola TaxID=2909342 RepID=UPI001F251732|nr:alanine/ornithine racemase family PLP-dependent enzyme [Octadecabacter algicola]MCF2906183.1 alanine/ornithine racemase family PLP-dependent enzyme [Octadecabacter algicola]